MDRKERIQQLVAEAQVSWRRLTKQIKVVRKDFDLETDGQRKVVLQERVADLEAMRDKMDSRLRRLERRLEALDASLEQSTGKRTLYCAGTFLVVQTALEIVVENVSDSPVAIRISWDENDPFGIGAGEDSFIGHWVEPEEQVKQPTINHTSVDVWAWGGGKGALLDHFKSLL